MYSNFQKSQNTNAIFNRTPLYVVFLCFTYLVNIYLEGYVKRLGNIHHGYARAMNDTFGHHTASSHALLCPAKSRSAAYLHHLETVDISSSAYIHEFLSPFGESLFCFRFRSQT